MIRVSAVLVDNSLPGSAPQPITFDFDGSCWYEAMDQLVTEYATQCRGGKLVDADRLVLNHFVAVNHD